MAEFNDLLSPDEALIPVSEELLNLTINIFDRSDEFMVRNQFRFVNGLTASLIKFSEMLTTDNCIIYHQFKETAELDSRMIEQD
ncbi:hypothetical protein [Leptospira santarosai]|uniref:hypothetical protein n=1 Tax=Leptospira santarosai TaxID=28183 RepID=UPI00051900F3|nr:hypothetical protein [Leptospira santarosai]